MTKKCIVCGEVFKTDYNWEITCSVGCKKNRRRDVDAVYRNKNKEIRRSKKFEYCEKNRERERNRSRKHYWENVDSKREYAKSYYHNKLKGSAEYKRKGKEYYEKRKEGGLAKEQSRRWRKDNPEKLKEITARHRKKHREKNSHIPCVYMFKSKEYMKVGTGKHMIVRYKSIKHYNPHDLRIYWFCLGDYRVEEFIKKLLTANGLHYYDEWFIYDKKKFDTVILLTLFYIYKTMNDTGYMRSHTV